MKVMDIKISDIEIVENVRTSVNDLQIKELMESVKQHGLEQPIGLGKTKSGKYTLIFGHRRLIACKKLGWKTIPASISEEPEIKEFLLLNITENIQRRDITPAELGRICGILMKRHDMTRQEISKRLGVPESRVKSAMESYRGIPDSLKEKIVFMEHAKSARNGGIPASIAIKMVQLRRLYKISEADVKTIMTDVRFQDLTNEDLDIIGKILSEGMKPLDALKEGYKYTYHRINVVVEIKELDEIQKKVGFKYASNYLRGIIYGVYPPIKRPDFFKGDRNVR